MGMLMLKCSAITSAVGLQADEFKTASIVGTSLEWAEREREEIREKQGCKRIEATTETSRRR